ncbi:MAG: cytochrome c biogenesis protein CcsA [Deltaproteobacteria bacterium]|nr:cytochrome c biogenesis protein CcsA [Deltaproteobacteria bacterium]
MPADRPLVAVALALVLFVGLMGRARPRASFFAAFTAMLTLVGLLGARWVIGGRPPVFGTFETSVAETFALLALALFVDRRLLPTGVLRGPAWLAAITLGHTFFLDNGITPLTISEISLWIDLHAPLAWLAWAFYLMAAAMAFVDEQRRQALATRLLGLAFFFHSAMAFVGIYYATLLFAKPWAWDPVQILALLGWTLAGVALHLHLFFRVSLYRLRYFIAFIALVYVLSGKLMMYLPFGQSFHVFELGVFVGGPK